MPVDFSDGGARAQAAHDCDQVSGVNLALVLLVVQREALLELCERENEQGKEVTSVRREPFPVRSRQHCELKEIRPFRMDTCPVMSETAEMITHKTGYYKLVMMSQFVFSHLIPFNERRAY